MATTALSNVTSLLKTVYEPRIVSQLRTKAVGWKRIQNSSEGVTESVGGKYVEFPIETGRNQGVSFRNESEQLGRPGRASFESVRVQLKYGYLRGRLTGQVMRLAKTNPQAFASALDRDQKSIKDQAAREQSRMFYGDGTGLLTDISADAALDVTFTASDVYWLEKTMDIDLRTKSTGAPLANGLDRNITGLVKSTSAVTVDAGIGTFQATAGTHGVYRQGNYNREPQGLRSIVNNSGVLYGVDPALVDVWVSPVTTGVGAISEGVLIKAVDDLTTDGGETSAIFTTLGVRRAYFNLLVQQRQFVAPKKFEGGLVGLGFNYGDREIPVVADPDLRETGVAYFIDESTFKFYQTHDWSYMDDDGSMFKWVADYDEWQYLMNKYYELGCSRRNANAKLAGITEG